MPRDKVRMTILSKRVGMVETDLSAALRKSLERQGLKTVKTKTDTHNGLPDIYVTGGNWIESKIERRIPSPKFTPVKLFTGIQRRELDQFVNAGDSPWACVLWTYDDLDKRIGVMPWFYFRRIRLWPFKTVHHFTEPYNDKRSLDLYVDKHLLHNSKVSMRAFMDRFDDWPDRDNPSYFKELIVPTYDDNEFTDDNALMTKRNII
jgi:hypothetical protein